jgi:hypothetical protein
MFFTSLATLLYSENTSAIRAVHESDFSRKVNAQSAFFED